MEISSRQKVSRFSRISWRCALWLPGIHLAAFVGAWWAHLSLVNVTVFLVSYCARIFGISAGYHRYFSHRSFKVSRIFQFILAVLALTSVQRGPLWWASFHRHHHCHSDRMNDIHSPVHGGVWWSYAGWLLERRHEMTKLRMIRDFSRFPELVWLDRHSMTPPFLLAVLTFIIGGFDGLYWGFILSTALLFHALALGNSAAHSWGERKYDTADNSRNNVLYSILTLGEYHNNHHYDRASANQALGRFQVDAIYSILCILAKIGLVKNLRQPRKLPGADHRP